MALGMHNQFGGWLNNTMQARRLSQADVARSIGVADAQVSRWRRGHVVPSVVYLQRIADAFGMQRATLEQLAGYPSAEHASAAHAEIDPRAGAELEAYTARMREIMASRLPPALWRSYAEACEALADGLTASLRFNASLRDVIQQAPLPVQERRVQKRALGFRLREDGES